jgi:hypothetical protein
MDANHIKIKNNLQELLDFFRPHSRKLARGAARSNVIGVNFKARTKTQMVDKSAATRRKEFALPSGTTHKSRAETLSAMRAGIKTITGGKLRSLYFETFPPLLVRVKGRSNFGQYQYEVWGKLKDPPDDPIILVELCACVEALAHVQGAVPEFVRILVSPGHVLSFPTKQLLPLFKQVERLFLNALNVPLSS